MKTLTWISSVFALAALPAMAGPTPPMTDVPAGHWAANAVRQVTANKLMTADPGGKFNGNKAVTRYELAVTLDRLVHYIEGAHKPLSALPPKPVTLPRSMPAGAATALAHLVGNGFLPRTSPLLLKAGQRPVTAQELADALAQVTVRLSDRSLPPQNN